MKQKIYEKLLTIDIGHGETSAAIINLKNNNIKSYYDLKLAQSSTGDPKKIMTAVYISDDGKTVEIGNDNILSENLPIGKIYKGFKTRPDKLESQKIFGYTKKELMKIYVRKLLEVIYELNPAYIKMSDNFKIVVGCPSDDTWLKYKGIYEDILKSATGRDIEVMPESRAAIIKVYNEQKNKIDLTKGTAVFDLGSITADYTYINSEGKRTSYLDSSKPIGASFIEEALCEYILDNMKYDPNYLRDINLSELELRQLKERYYDGRHAMSKKPVTGYLIPKDRHKEYIEVSLKDDIMNYIIYKHVIVIPSNDSKPEYMSWYESCKKFLNDRKKELGSKPLKTILVTGGASRMDFIENLFKDVFKEQEIIIDREPSYCVSRGLALAGYTDYHSDALFKEATKNIKSKMISSLDNFISGVSKKYSVKCYEIMKEELEKWSELEHNNQTLKHVSILIETYSKSYFDSDESKKVITSEFVKWADSLRKIIVSEVNSSFSKKYPNSINDIPKFNLSDNKWAKIKESISGGNGVDFDSKKVLEYIDLDGNAVYAKLAVSVVAFIPYLIVGIIPVFGKKIQEAMDSVADKLWDNTDKVMSKKRREEAYKSVLNEKEKYTEKIEQEISLSIKETFDNASREVLVNKTYSLIEDTIKDAIDTVGMYFA